MSERTCGDWLKDGGVNILNDEEENLPPGIA